MMMVGNVTYYTFWYFTAYVFVEKDILLTESAMLTFSQGITYTIKTVVWREFLIFRDIYC